MALNLALSALRFGPANAPHIIELYLDFVCPFSKKQYLTLANDVFPNFQSGPFHGKVQFLFRNQVQPWHPSSTLVHEASIAAAKLAPEHWWQIATSLFEESEQYYDTATAHESRQETYGRLATLVSKASSGTIKSEQVLQELSIGKTEEGKTPSNRGNKVTDLLKKQIKLGRQTGIHVSPTVLVDGLIDGQISSSWSPQDWNNFLKELTKSN